MGRSANATKNGARRLLVADDDAALRKSLSRLLGTTCDIELARGCKAAIRALDAGNVLGLIVDLKLPDGDGFQVVERARAADPSFPVLMITGHLDPDIAARAYAMGITFLPKPVRGENLLAFARRCLSHEFRASARLEAQGFDWEARYHLTRTERDLLLDTARGMSREELIASRGIAETTLKRHVTNLLEKTLEASLDRAALRFLRELLRDLN